MDIVIAAGVESMSRVPMGSDSQALNKGALDGTTADFMPFKLIHQGVSAEMISERWGLTREQLDEFAAKSHERAFHAQRAGAFDKQIVPIAGADPRTQVTQDEGVRYPVDLQKMAALKTIFRRNGTIHAGNASQISDGAAAVLLASAEKANQLGLRKRARVVARVVVGDDPELMLAGLCARAGWCLLSSLE